MPVQLGHRATAWLHGCSSRLQLDDAVAKVEGGAERTSGPGAGCSRVLTIRVHRQEVLAHVHQCGASAAQAQAGHLRASGTTVRKLKHCQCVIHAREWHYRKETKTLPAPNLSASSTTVWTLKYCQSVICLRRALSQGN